MEEERKMEGREMKMEERDMEEEKKMEGREMKMEEERKMEERKMEEKEMEGREMKVFDREGFPNPARVRMALAEKGAMDQVEFVPVDVMGGEHRTAAFRARNPDATIPYIELQDGSCISQCTAITEYIDGHFDGPELIGTTPQMRARVHMMNLRAEAGLVDAVGAYFHHATPGLGPDLETDQNADWGRKRKEVALDTMRYLDGVLAEQPFLAGDSFTMADITAFAGLAFADFAKIEIPADLTHLAKWRQRVAARPSCAN